MTRHTYHESSRTTVLPRWYEKNPTIDIASLNKIFLGVVKDSRDPQGMGRLLVWIPELTGDPNVPDNWVICAYASPFAGASYFDFGIHFDQDGSNAVESIRDRATQAGRMPQRNQSQLSGRQSYGMWFVPPDVGNEVLVTFVNGDPNSAVWFGCLFQQDMTQMIPGIGRNVITAGSGENTMADEQGPVLETDLSVENSQNVSDEPQRRMFQPLRDGLKLQQGLNRDEIRGQSTSSARREARQQPPLPSEVFGVLTPNGNHFVLDDSVSSEFIRMRTRSGAQLLINQSNGFIYAITKDGRTWIELSNEGNVDIYASLNISLHAENGNINMRAGQDVNIQAVRDLNIRSDQDLKIAAIGDIDIKGQDNIQIQVEGQIHQKSGGVFKQTSGGSFEILAADDYSEDAPNIFMNSGRSTPALDARFPRTATPAGPSMFENGEWMTGEPYQEGTNIATRVPQHEPYSEHDFISTDDVFIPGPTQSFNNEQRVRPINTPVNTETVPANIDPPDENSPPPTKPNITPLPENGVCGLTREETQSLMDVIGFRESSGRNNIENTLGFVGKYQFGSAALEDVGLIQPGTFRNNPSNSTLNNPSNWTIPGGKEEFLNSPDLQEQAMLRLMNRNCTVLTNSGNINNNTSKQQIAGLLSASHIGGPGGAQALLAGNNRTDAYGGSTSEYFQLGAAAQRDFERGQLASAAGV